ncbi:hypothetical protein EJP82_25950 [Paenibacillus anaericanus]|uniref:Uncharacterized protein n=1 Tax=Paenibacillus anaericanus TaxID=170367 RepID=A0A3S1DJG2_9BACL|nr:hypothetical protein [Paenibacillus anaericanus]RUT39526.1 hypothetical protein EJP82_25950 [Paenibacillus anaericanus]
MENLQTYLKWVIGLLFTLVIIAAGIMIWNQTQPMLQMANRQAVEQAQAIADDEFSAYDYQLVSGSQVLTAVRRYAMKDVFYIYVKTTKSEFIVKPSGTTTSCPRFDYTNGSIVTGTTSCNITTRQMMDINDTNYVPPQGRFRSTLLRDDNDRITGIYFKQQ